jgi:hypothetical protein
MQLFVGNKPFHGISFLCSGLVPPSVQKGHLNDSELIFWMFSEFLDDGVDGVLDSSELGSHVSSVEVVVDCLEPSDIIMGVGDEMNGKGRSVFGVFLVVMFLHHFLVCVPLC